MQVEQLDKKIEAITLIYNQERNNYYHCQNLVEQERQKYDLDFKAAAEKIQVTEILSNYVDKLDKMRVAGQPLFDARNALSE
jgi:histone deacetylase complex regulatory component SIN3